MRKEEQTKDSYSFALIADSHTYFNDLEKTVKALNKNKDIAFVLHMGDLTSDGLVKEYRWTYNLLKKIDKPLLTVIGNHDFLNNGQKIYKRIFGDLNYTFTFNNDKFIVVDTNVWASSGNIPDMNWLESEIKASGDYDHVFVLSHIAPFGDQFNAKKEEEYRALMEKYQIDYSIHGHDHAYFNENYYNDGTPYLLIDTVKHANYSVMTVTGTDIKIKRIFF